MKVAYDHQIFSGQAYGGISRYFCEIAERIALSNNWEVKILAPLHVNVFARDIRHLLGVRMPAVPKTVRLRSRLNAALVKMLLRYDPPDAVSYTHLTLPTICSV